MPYASREGGGDWNPVELSFRGLSFHTSEEATMTVGRGVANYIEPGRKKAETEPQALLKMKKEGKC